jgi:hypothetical protein
MASGSVSPGKAINEAASGWHDFGVTVFPDAVLSELQLHD